jgi:hypothetical protein
VKATSRREGYIGQHRGGLLAISIYANAEPEPASILMAKSREC